MWAWLRGTAAGAICVAMLIVTVLTFGELLDSSPTNPQHPAVLAAPAKHPVPASGDGEREWRHHSPAYRECTVPGRVSASIDPC